MRQLLTGVTFGGAPASFSGTILRIGPALGECTGHDGERRVNNAPDQLIAGQRRGLRTPRPEA